MASEPLHNAYGKSLASAAVGVGRRFAGASPEGGEVGNQAGDRVAARMIGAKNLRQERPQGDEGRKDSIASADPFGRNGLGDGVGVEQIGEGKLGLVAKKMNLVANALPCDTAHHRMASLPTSWNV